MSSVFGQYEGDSTAVLPRQISRDVCLQYLQQHWPSYIQTSAQHFSCRTCFSHKIKTTCEMFNRQKNRLSDRSDTDQREDIGVRLFTISLKSPQLMFPGYILHIYTRLRQGIASKYMEPTLFHEERRRETNIDGRVEEQKRAWARNQGRNRHFVSFFCF